MIHLPLFSVVNFPVCGGGGSSSRAPPIGACIYSRQLQKTQMNHVTQGGKQ